MRRRVASAVLALAVLAVACSDTPRPTAPLRPFDGMMSKTLDDFIQTAINDFLPTGFEDAVDARWSTIKNKKNSGDFAGAVKQFNTLAAWIDKKTPDITAPAGMTQAQAAVLIVVNMGRWLYLGANVDPLAVPTGDVALDVIPSGGALETSVPSKHAAVRWAAGASQEERVIVVIEDPQTYPDQCQGPLPTNRCQYPLFYKVESFPHTRLTTPGRLAVCLVTTGDRRPIEYPEDEPDEPGHHGPVGERMALAHQKPANPNDYTPGSTIDGDIEILPISVSQSTLTDCSSHSTLNMGPIEKALYLASNFVGKIISPKSAYAYDQGPEHEFSFFSNFNAVDVASQPDVTVDDVVVTHNGFIGSTLALSYDVANASRRATADATGTAVGVVVSAYLSSDQIIDAGDQVLGTSNLGAIIPDGTAQPVSHSGITLPSTPGTYYVIVSASQTGGLAEISSANNTVITEITLTDEVFATGFELTDAVWSATVGAFWHTSAVNVTNQAYPSLVDLAVGDASAGALPGPFGGSSAMWFGEEATGNYAGALQNANGGGTSTAARSGRVTSPTFTVPTTNNAVSLSFRNWFEIESVDADRFDMMTVWVEDLATSTMYNVRTLNPATDQNGPARTPFTSGGFNLPPAWNQQTVDLSAFRGKQVRLSFLFDTRDVQYNGFRGWIVDDVDIRVLGFAPAMVTTFLKAKSTDGSLPPVTPREWHP